MRLTRLFSFIVLALLLAGPATASAGWLNELGRYTGLGWSEGCPDPRYRAQPWQRRANRSGPLEDPLVPYLEPHPAPRPAPEPLPQPKVSRTKAPAGESTPARTSQLHISRPKY